MRVLKLDGELYSVEFKRYRFAKALMVHSPRLCDYAIAHFAWQEYTGEIRSVYVERGYRRRGIATALLKLAEEIQPIKHSEERTPAGDAWARSTGMPVPDADYRLPQFD